MNKALFIWKEGFKFEKKASFRYNNKKRKA